jgi:VCBS repeat-containing protein
MLVIDENYEPTHTYTVQTDVCINCGELGRVIVDAQGLFMYNQGNLKELREQLMTGTHPQCFEEMFAGLDEE